MEGRAARRNGSRSAVAEVVSCSERHFSLFLLFSQRIISERGRDPRGNPRFPAARQTE
jgi:hypothetical protein